MEEVLLRRLKFNAHVGSKVPAMHSARLITHHAHAILTCLSMNGLLEHCFWLDARQRRPRKSKLSCPDHGLHPDRILPALRATFVFEAFDTGLEW